MSLIPQWMPRFPKQNKSKTDLFHLGDFFKDLEEEMLPAAMQTAMQATGLSISSDDRNVYIEASVPGLTSKDIDVSIDNDNVLWIKGEKKLEEQDKKKKYYRQSQRSFAYALPLSDEIDKSIEPEAACKDGIMTIIFAKKKDKQVESKKITVK